MNRGGGRVDTEGAMSDYWDLESSHASQQLNQIGRLGTDDQEYTQINFEDMHSDLKLSDRRLDSGVMIRDPLEKVQRLGKQTSDDRSHEGSSRHEDSDSCLEIDSQANKILTSSEVRDEKEMESLIMGRDGLQMVERNTVQEKSKQRLISGKEESLKDKSR